ncbi:ParB N-terminal domain-containing protein [Candidatus Amarobacter glycogenicus]|uniref:ParB N-terminal domain-containing protein n=1 Tax=Candidatus Amarobacter glycogenicus TaxID=3140699 RepID=UPI0031CC4C18
MSHIKRGLGRGLSALIPTTPTTSPEVSQALVEIEITAIAPNPRQPRQAFDSEALQELAASIREHGLIQPLIVTRAAGGQADAGGPAYYLIAGAPLACGAPWPVSTRCRPSSRRPAQAVLEMALVEMCNAPTSTRWKRPPPTAS